VTANFSTELLSDDLAAVFDDWQEQVTYRQVASTLDPATETRSETPTDTLVAAVVRSISSREVADAAGMYRVGDVWVLVRDSDIPERPPRRTSRIVRAGEVYSIVGYQRSGYGLSWQLHCRRA